MRTLLRIFISDWRRKVTALVMAFALWLWVDGQISEQQTHTWRIVTTSRESAVENGTLQIRVPEGWRMTRAPSTSSENQAKLQLTGSPSQIDAFLASGFSASFDPALDGLPDNADFHELKVSTSDLRWTRPEQAARILQLDSQSAVLSFRFDRVSLERIAMEPHLIDIVSTPDAPPAGYLALTDELSFSVSHIYLEGTVERVAGVQFAMNKRKEAIENGQLELLAANPGLFAPLVLSSDDRNDLEVSLRLSAVHEAAGLRLISQEGAIIARLPIRLKDQLPRPIELDRENVSIVPDPEDQWVTPEWVKTDIRVVLSSQPAIGFDINEDWLFRHLLFILPLDRIPNDVDQNDYTLQWDWTLIGLEEDVKAEVLRRLSITFMDPSKRTVIVQRKQ